MVTKKLNMEKIFKNLSLNLMMIDRDGSEDGDEDDKFYRQFFQMIHFMNYKMLQYEKMDVSEGIDVNKQVHQKNMSFVSIGFLKISDLNLKNMFVMDLMIY